MCLTFSSPPLPPLNVHPFLFSLLTAIPPSRLPHDLLLCFLFVLTSLQMTIAAVATKAEEEVAAGGTTIAAAVASATTAAGVLVPPPLVVVALAAAPLPVTTSPS